MAGLRDPQFLEERCIDLPHPRVMTAGGGVIAATLRQVAGKLVGAIRVGGRIRTPAPIEPNAIGRPGVGSLPYHAPSTPATAIVAAALTRGSGVSSNRREAKSAERARPLEKRALGSVSSPRVTGTCLAWVNDQWTRSWFESAIAPTSNGCPPGLLAVSVTGVCHAVASPWASVPAVTRPKVSAPPPCGATVNEPASAPSLMSTLLPRALGGSNDVLTVPAASPIGTLCRSGTFSTRGRRGREKPCVLRMLFQPIRHIHLPRPCGIHVDFVLGTNVITDGVGAEVLGVGHKHG